MRNRHRQMGGLLRKSDVQDPNGQKMMPGPRHSSPNVPDADSPRSPNLGAIHPVTKKPSQGPYVQLFLPWGSGALPQHSLPTELLTETDQTTSREASTSSSHRHHRKHKRRDGHSKHRQTSLEPGEEVGEVEDDVPQPRHHKHHHKHKHRSDRGHKGALLLDDRDGDSSLERGHRGHKGALLLDDRDGDSSLERGHRGHKGALLLDDRDGDSSLERGHRGHKGALLLDDRDGNSSLERGHRGHKGALLLDDRKPSGHVQGRGHASRHGAMLMDDREKRVHRGHTGAKLIEDSGPSRRGHKGALLLDDRAAATHRGYTGPIFKEDRKPDVPRAYKEGHNSDDRSDTSYTRRKGQGALLMEDRAPVRDSQRRGSSGALLLEDRDEVYRGNKGAMLLEDVGSRRRSKTPLVLDDRGLIRKGSFAPENNLAIGHMALSCRYQKEALRLEKNALQRQKQTVLLEDRNPVRGSGDYKGAMLIEDRQERGHRSHSGALLLEDSADIGRRNSHRSQTLLLDDRDPATLIEKEKRRLYKEHKKDRRSRHKHRSKEVIERVGQTGAVLREERPTERPLLIENGEMLDSPLSPQVSEEDGDATYRKQPLLLEDGQRCSSPRSPRRRRSGDRSVDEKTVLIENGKIYRSPERSVEDRETVLIENGKLCRSPERVKERKPVLIEDGQICPSSPAELAIERETVLIEDGKRCRSPEGRKTMLIENGKRCDSSMEAEDRKTVLIEDGKTIPRSAEVVEERKTVLIEDGKRVTSPDILDEEFIAVDEIKCESPEEMQNMEDHAEDGDVEDNGAMVIERKTVLIEDGQICNTPEHVVVEETQTVLIEDGQRVNGDRSPSRQVEGDRGHQGPVEFGVERRTRAALYEDGKQCRSSETNYPAQRIREEQQSDVGDAPGEDDGEMADSSRDLVNVNEKGGYGSVDRHNDNDDDNYRHGNEGEGEEYRREGENDRDERRGGALLLEDGEVCLEHVKGEKESVEDLEEGEYNSDGTEDMSEFNLEDGEVLDEIDVVSEGEFQDDIVRESYKEKLKVADEKREIRKLKKRVKAKLKEDGKYPEDSGRFDDEMEKEYVGEYRERSRVRDSRSVDRASYVCEDSGSSVGRGKKSGGALLIEDNHILGKRDREVSMAREEYPPARSRDVRSMTRERSVTRAAGPGIVDGQLGGGGGSRPGGALLVEDMQVVRPAGGAGNDIRPPIRAQTPLPHYEPHPPPWAPHAPAGSEPQPYFGPQSTPEGFDRMLMDERMRLHAGINRGREQGMKRPLGPAPGPTAKWQRTESAYRDGTPLDGRGDGSLGSLGKAKRIWTPSADDLKLQQCVRSGTPPKAEEEELSEPVPAWVRCSAADLYFTRDRKTGNMVTTKRMRDLEDKFYNDLVLRSSKVKADQEPYVMSRNTKPNWKHAHKCCVGHPSGNSHGGQCLSSDSESGESDEDENEDETKEELRFKLENPYRMHKEIWYNEPDELNDGPLCRCSLKSQKFGIRHNIYPGEEPIPMCDVNSNNLDKLHHYKITVSPTTNFLTKHPTVIMFDGHEYIFEGFSMFSHTKLPELPPCQVIRFNIVYTIHLLEEPVPENFSIRSLDLLTKYIFDEVLELFDIDWKGHKATDDHCRRFHMMPRFARPFPENGKELLSMNDILLYLLKISKPLVDQKELPNLLELQEKEWDKFVDSFRHVVVSCPGKRPSSIRIDQLDRKSCVSNTTRELKHPIIVHHGVRPALLSYAGDPVYKKTHRDYMKYRHLMCTRAKVTTKDKEKLADYEFELERIRSKYSLKREVTSDISSDGFLITGIRADICQHAMLLPVLFGHIRFHSCLNVLEKKIGYEFKDKSLLQLALTHSSYKINYGTNIDHGRNALSNCGFRQLEFGDAAVHVQHTRKRGLNVLLRIMARFGKKEEVRSDIPHNERLEYLGDAVVEFITSTHLYNMLPHATEGELTIYRVSLVQNAHLAILADKLRLQDYLLYAHGTDLCHNSTLKHAMANCFEAFMGALFLDGGIELADRVFSTTLFGDEPDMLDTWVNTLPHPLIQDEPDTDRHWIQQSHILQKLLKFEEEIGYEFNHIRLLARALTMRHVGFNNLTLGHNQRMEFLGDSIMQLIASDYLYKHFPDHHEGHLTLLRSSLVSNHTQSTVADEIGLPTYLVKPHKNSKDGSGYNDRKPELKMKERADLLEALLGALYVDGGLEPCKVMCEVCFFPRLRTFIMNQDWNDPKSHLQQCCLTMRSLDDESPDIPIYKVLQKVGPTNLRRYKVGVYFREKRLAIGEGGSIQQAEMQAAGNALQTAGVFKQNVLAGNGRKGPSKAMKKFQHGRRWQNVPNTGNQRQPYAGNQRQPSYSNQRQPNAFNQRYTNTSNQRQSNTGNQRPRPSPRKQPNASN